MLITNRAGVAGIAGSLADGTAMSQSVPVSEDGSVPVYASLYGGQGLLMGWINLSNMADASLTWVHPGRLSGIYTNEFINVPQLLLSPWTNAAGSFEGLTNLSILDTINGGEVLTNFAASISPSGKVSGRALSGSIVPRTGQFTLTIGSGAGRVTGRGAILLNAGYGGGYFLNKSWAGSDPTGAVRAHPLGQIPLAPQFKIKQRSDDDAVADFAGRHQAGHLVHGNQPGR